MPSLCRTRRPSSMDKRSSQTRKPVAKPVTPPRATVPSRAGLLALMVLVIYALALLYARETVPAGMNNDVAEEALRGVYLVEGHHFEVITFSIGNSAETLYL